jgi:hypothetical protein
MFIGGKLNIIRKALLLLFVFSFAMVAGTQFIKLGKTNLIPDLYTYLTLENPQNTTYNVNTVTLKFSAEFVSFSSSFNFSYALDAQEQKPIENITIISESGIPINPGIYRKTLNGSCILSNLSEGWHNITVYQTGYKEKIFAFANAKFMIDTNPPIVSVLSLENKTYATSNVPLNFTVSEQTAWVGYSLDEQANITMTENTTLTGLLEGPHCLVIYAEDTAGNTGGSETIDFSLQKKTEAFPTTWNALAIATIAITGAAFMIYFVKFKKAKEKAKQ